MSTKRLLFSVITFWFLSATQAQGVPDSADKILKNALHIAATQNKNVFIIFHASWCIWCHKMDSSMNDETCRSFFNDNYIIRHIVVQESKNKKNLENPGGMEMLAKYKGEDQGIPFWLVFDKNGKLLADSQMRKEGEELDKKGQNTGCPATAEEVNNFIMVLKKTSRLTEAELSVIRQRFRQNE